MDFANDTPLYSADIDVRELICLADVMETFGLGPNGGTAHCVVNWLMIIRARVLYGVS